VEADFLVSKIVGYLEFSSIADFADQVPLSHNQNIKISQNFALVNFCQLVIHACSRSAGDVFDLLEKHYLTRLSVPSQDALHLVQKLYYPVQKKINRIPAMNMNAMMNSVMNMFGPAPSASTAPPDID
jgi:Golgi to ER traffic protein 4